MPGPTTAPRLRSARAPAARRPRRTLPTPKLGPCRRRPRPPPSPEGRPRSAHLVAAQRTPGSSRPARAGAERRESRGPARGRRRRCPRPTRAAHVQRRGNNMAAGRGGARGRELGRRGPGRRGLGAAGRPALTFCPLRSSPAGPLAKSWSSPLTNPTSTTTGVGRASCPRRRSSERERERENFYL